MADQRKVVKGWEYIRLDIIKKVNYSHHMINILRQAWDVSTHNTKLTSTAAGACLIAGATGGGPIGFTILGALFTAKALKGVEEDVAQFDAKAAKGPWGKLDHNSL